MQQTIKSVVDGLGTEDHDEECEIDSEIKITAANRLEANRGGGVGVGEVGGQAPPPDKVLGGTAEAPHSSRSSKPSKLPKVTVLASDKAVADISCAIARLFRVTVAPSAAKSTTAAAVADAAAAGESSADPLVAPVAAMEDLDRLAVHGGDEVANLVDYSSERSWAPVSALTTYRVKVSGWLAYSTLEESHWLLPQQLAWHR